MLLEEILPWLNCTSFVFGWNQYRNPSTVLPSVNISILNATAVSKAQQLARLKLQVKGKGIQ